MPSSDTLAENVAAALRHAILGGAYLCGERLVELTLADEMNVSQNTVRDALRLLEQDGLVAKQARRGTYVRDFTPDETLEVYLLWAAVESLALQWALEHMTPAHMASLRPLFDQFRDYPNPENRFRIHAALVGIAAKPRTAELLRPLHYQARLLQNPQPPLPAAQQILVYDALLAALRAGDAPRAQHILRQYLQAEGQALAAQRQRQPQYA